MRCRSSRYLLLALALLPSVAFGQGTPTAQHPSVYSIPGPAGPVGPQGPAGSSGVAPLASNTVPGLMRGDGSTITQSERPGQVPCRTQTKAVVYHRLNFIHRFQIGTTYPDVVQGVQRVLTQLPPRRDRPELVVDATGVGRPVLDVMRERGLKPIGITITGGIDAVEREWNDIRVPKRTLAAIMQVVLQSGRLKIAADMELTPALDRELQTFKVKINVNGSEAFEAWRETDHDDLVLAAALAVWRAENRKSSLDTRASWRGIGR